MKTEEEVKNKIAECSRAIDLINDPLKSGSKFNCESDLKAIELEATENGLIGYKTALEWVLED